MTHPCDLCLHMETKPHRTIYETPLVRGMLILEPLREGHSLLLPKRHVTTLEELTAEERKDFLESIPKLAKILTGVYGHDCLTFYNQGFHSTQHHLHMHVLPLEVKLRTVFSKAFNQPERNVSSDEDWKRIQHKIQSALRQQQLD